MPVIYHFAPANGRGCQAEFVSISSAGHLFLRERGIEDGIGRSAGLARRVARGEAEGRRRGGVEGEGAEGGKREEAVTLKGWIHMLKKVNISLINDA